MKVAYIFTHPRGGTYKLGQMILPQLEMGVHGVDVAGMFFFNDLKMFQEVRCNARIRYHSNPSV
jgi:hypothetical protein